MVRVFVTLLLLAGTISAADAQTSPTPSPTPMSDEQKLKVRLAICRKHAVYNTVPHTVFAPETAWEPDYAAPCAQAKADEKAFYAARDAAAAKADLNTLQTLAPTPTPSP